MQKKSSEIMESTGTEKMKPETSSDITGSAYSYLKSECDRLGISVSKLCREANIERSLLERWRQKDPKSLQMYNALKEALLRLDQPKNLPNS